MKSVPLVEGALPIFGHGLAFSKDIIGFVTQCFEKYGKIFRIKIFRVDMIVICDRSLNSEFFKATEDRMSLYDVLNRLYFGDAFSDNPNSLPQIIAVVKKSIAVRYDTFVPKIEAEAHRMIARLRTLAEEKDGQKIDLITEMTRFVATTSASCFISFELSDRLFQILLKFTHFLNQVVVLTYFLPKWLLRLLVNPFLSRLRKQITSALTPEIESYRSNPDKDDSLVLRTAVDYIDAATGLGLSNQEIGDIVVCLLYVSSENTALGLTNSIVELACSPIYWEKCKAEAASFLRVGDIKGLFASQLLNACVMETARLNSHIFALNRKPLDKGIASIGNYFVGDADSIALCEPLLMVHGTADEVFSNPKTYNPSRFLTQNKEPLTSHTVMTWGAGVHQCPGKIFSIYEIKMALALILTNFEFVLEDGAISKIDYFSPSAFAERKVAAVLKPLKESLTPELKQVTLVHGHKVEYLPQGGWLLRDCLSREEQTDFYQDIFNLSQNSLEHKEILNIPLDKVYPFAYHNLIYTGKSNMASPGKWYSWAEGIWEVLAENREATNFKGPSCQRFNSLYAQLYGAAGSMALHKDEFVSWGVSVNLGASATFNFGGDKILLHSGDVVVADFSGVEHGVEAVHQSCMPDWFCEESGIQSFGRVRCSVQIRDVSNIQMERILSTEEFKELIK